MPTVIPSTKENKVLSTAQAAAEVLKKASRELNKVGTTEPKVVTKTKAEDLRNKYGY